MEMSLRPTACSSSVCDLWVVLVVLSVWISLASVANAQQEQNNQQPGVSATGSTQADARSAAQNDNSEAEIKVEQGRTSDRRGSFVIAPLPISSPALGTGIVPVLGYIFPLRKDDHVSPPSVVGMVGLATDNGSRGFGAYADLYMKENAYRISTIYVRGNVNYNFYGLGLAAGDAGHKLPLEHSGQVFRSEVLRRVGWDFFLGVRFWIGSSDIVVRSTSDTKSEPAPPPDVGLQTSLRALGVRLNRETTPNRFYPTSGTLLDFTSTFFSEALGSKYSFQSYRFTFNKYGSLSKTQVLAYNLFVCGTGGQPPFYGECIYGTNNELRGYTAGQYLDRYMFATQLEYRLSLPKRFGVVGFGGIGEVVPGGSEAFRINYLLPAGGGGLRFQLSKAYRVNLRADFARGKDTWTWSMGVGEAF